MPRLRPVPLQSVKVDVRAYCILGDNAYKTLFRKREKLLIPLETERYVRSLLLIFSVNAFDSFLSLYGRKKELRISSFHVKSIFVNSLNCTIPQCLNFSAILSYCLTASSYEHSLKPFVVLVIIVKIDIISDKQPAPFLEKIVCV